MKPFRIFLAIPFLIFLSPLPSQAGEQRSYDIPKLQGVTIDGKTSDWRDQGFRVEAMSFSPKTRVPLPQDFAPRFRLGWDERGLLLLVEITDDIPKETRDFLGTFDYDSVQVCLESAGEKPILAELLTRPGLDPLLPGFWHFYSVQNEMKMGGPLQIAREKTNDGYCLEVLFPWSDLKVSPKEGLEVGFQIRANDRDLPVSGPQDKAVRAAWYPEWDLPFSRDRAHRLRLSANASPPVLAGLSYGYNPGGLPWVHVIGVPSLAGKPVLVLEGSRKIAEGILANAGGQARCTLLLPRRTDKKPSGDLSVRMDDEILGTAYLTKAVDSGEIRVTAASSPEGTAQYHVNIQSGLAGDQSIPAACVVRVFSPEGGVVRHAKCLLEDTVEFALPSGLYNAIVDTRNFGGYPLHGETWFLLDDTSQTLVRTTLLEARRLGNDASLRDYAGWFDYLAGKIETRLQKEQPPSNNTVRMAFDLCRWMDRATSDPHAIAAMRGVCEWAYLSQADDTGQPFGLFVPTDYNPRKSYPLEVYLHGNGATHVSSLVLLSDLGTGPGFQLRVLGRAPGSGYAGLAETDVLDALAYVRSHWNIDPDRIQIVGESMGGYGTISIASRHPDLFASARMLCSGLGSAHAENLLHVPVFAFHSRDDGMVPICGSRMAVQLLDELGSGIAFLETDGVNHAVWMDREGYRKAQAWADGKKRNEQVHRVRYTAIDESARGAYWAQVLEWGPEGTPASFDARFDTGNSLSLSLENVGTLRIDLAACPVDRTAPLFISINGGVVPQQEAPLPEALYISAKDNQYDVSGTAPALPRERLHFPGGAMALYHGEPLLIVWGTQGDAQTNQEMYNVAQVARRSPSPAWPKGEALTREGLPNEYILYGLLPGKPDTEVTGEDMAKYNLLLLGDNRQNSVIARIGDRLPVRIQQDTIVASDGATWDYGGHALGLLYFNPEHPNRLIYWVASASSRFYRPEPLLMKMQARDPAPPDFLVTGTEREIVHAARRFDSRWAWEKGYLESPILPDAAPGTAGHATTICRTLRHATGADFALAAAGSSSTSTLTASADLRQADLAALEYDTRILILDLSGEELRKAAQASLGDSITPDNPFLLLPSMEEKTLDPRGQYSLAMPASLLGWYAWATRQDPSRFRFPPDSLRDAIFRCRR